jgi:hypothetical protein
LYHERLHRTKARAVHAAVEEMPDHGAHHGLDVADRGLEALGYRDE